MQRRQGLLPKWLRLSRSWHHDRCCTSQTWQDVVQGTHEDDDDDDEDDEYNTDSHGGDDDDDDDDYDDDEEWDE